MALLLAGAVGVEVIRNSRGEWCVAVPVERFSYGSTYNMRELKRIPITKETPRDRAEFVARTMGMMDGGNPQ